jgi:hypothetical protein
MLDHQLVGLYQLQQYYRGLANLSSLIQFLSVG